MKRILIFCLMSVITRAYAQPDHFLPAKSLIRNSDTMVKKEVVFLRCGSGMTKADQPLLVVDGIVEGNNSLKDIPPTEIESITVLKESTATALYGDKAIRSVIVMTTKKSRQRTFSVRSKEDGTPVAGATIKIVHDKAPTDTITMVADDKGEVITDKLKYKTTYTAIISSIGYKPKIFSLVFKTHSDQPVLYMERKDNVCEAVSVVAYPNRRVICRCGWCLVTTRTRRGEPKIAMNIAVADVYPNPASSSGQVHWQLDQSFNGIIQVHNGSGQLMQSSLISGLKDGVLSYRLPNLRAGTYFVRLIDLETSKTRNEKLVVQ